MRKKVVKNSIIVLLFLVLSYIYIAIPLRSGFIYVGSDRIFHLARLEEFYQTFSQNHSVPLISTYSFSKVGQAINTFYPWGNLLPYVLIRSLVSKPVTAYYLYIMLEQFLGLIIAFFAGSKISRSTKKALLFSLLLRFSAYIMHDDFARADIGESWAIIFIPLTFAGLIIILQNKQYLLGSLSITLGLTAELYSHLLTAVLTIFVVLVIYLGTLWKQEKRFEIFRTLALSALSFILCTIGFLYPLLDAMFKEKTIMPTKGDFSNYSFAPMDLLGWSMNNVVNMNQPNIGIWLLATIFIGTTALKRSSSIDKSAYFLGTFFCLLGTDLLPWAWLHNTAIESIQFPWRFFPFAILFLSYFASSKIIDSFNSSNLLVGLSIIVILTTLNSTNKYFAQQKNMYSPATKQVDLESPWSHLLTNMSYTKIWGSSPSVIENTQYHDYLPKSKGQDFSTAFSHELLDGKEKVLLKKSQIKSSFQGESFSFNIKQKQNRQITLPFYIYQKKQYSLMLNGEKKDFTVNKNNLITFKTHKNGKNIAQIRYITPKLYSVLQGVSLLAIICELLVLLLCSIYKFKSKRKDKVFSNLSRKRLDFRLFSKVNIEK